MAIIKVDTGGIEGLRQTVSVLNNKTSEALDYILYCERNLDMKTASSERISARINALQRRIAAQQNKVEQYERALTSVNEKFSTTDKWIKNKAKEVDYLLEKITVTPYFNSRNTLAIKTQFDDVNKLLTLMNLEDVNKFTTKLDNLMDEFEVKSPASALGSFSFSMIFINNLKWYDELIFCAKEWKNATLAMILGFGSKETTSDMFLTNRDECLAVLKGVIEDLCGTEYEFSLSGDEKEMLSIVQGLAEKSGFKDAAKFMDYLKDIVGDVGVVEKMMKDYSQNYAMLESLKQIAPDNSVLSETIDALIKEYELQSKGILDRVIEQSQKSAINIADKLLDSKFGAVDTVIQGVLGKVPSVSAIETVVYSSSLKASAIQALENAAQVLKNGSTSDADILNYENAFNVAKSLVVKEYEAMMSYYEKGTDEYRFLYSELFKLKQTTPYNYSSAGDFNTFVENPYNGGFR